MQQQPQQQGLAPQLATLFAQPGAYQQQAAGAPAVVQPGKQADGRWAVMNGGNPYNPTACTAAACAKQAPCYRNHAYKP